MQEIVDYLTQQISLAEDVFAGLEDVKSAVKTSVGGKEISLAVRGIEPLLRVLDDSAGLQQDILAAWGAGNMEELIMANSDLPEHTEAMNLLYALNEWQMKLKVEMAVVRELLTRSKKFIDYSVNVLAAARVDGTYGPPGTRESGVSGRKIYEANV